MKRLLMLLMACAMLAGCLAGCGGGGKDPVVDSADTTTAQRSEGEVPGYDDDGYLLDDLPSDLNYRNADGPAPIKILHWTECDIFNPDEDAEKNVIEQACYNRNLRVEARLGVELEWKPAKGHGSAQQEFLTKVQQAMTAGDDGKYDLIATYNQTAGLVAAYGYAKDLYEAKYLDFEKPWWPESLTTSFTIGGKLYLASGDISEAFLAEMIATLYNKDALKNEDLYGLVRNGEWALEKLMELSANQYVDDENGKKDTGDIFGVVIPWDSYMDAFFYASDLTVVETEEDGLSVSPTFVGERADDLSKTLQNLFYESNDGFMGNSESIINLFARGDSLFMIAPGAMILGTKSMQETTMKYGILPMPKWNSDQEKYKTTISNLYSLYLIFDGCTDIDRAGAVMECLASEGYRKISPAVFELSLKVKYANDGDSAEMYDLVRNGVTFDVGRVYSTASLQEIPTSKWKRSVIDRQGWGAQSASVDAQLQRLLDQLYDSFVAN